MGGCVRQKFSKRQDQSQGNIMTKPTLASLDKRVTKVEVQLEERWKEAILRVKRIEAIILASAGAMIIMLVSILTRM